KPNSAKKPTASRTMTSSRRSGDRRFDFSPSPAGDGARRPAFWSTVFRRPGAVGVSLMHLAPEFDYRLISNFMPSCKGRRVKYPDKSTVIPLDNCFFRRLHLSHDK